MVKLPYRMNPFEFVVLAGLRAAQLRRGCTPRVVEGAKLIVTAQQEVAEGKVLRQTQTVVPPAVTPVDQAAAPYAAEEFPGASPVQHTATGSEDVQVA